MKKHILLLSLTLAPLCALTSCGGTASSSQLQREREMNDDLIRRQQKRLEEQENEKLQLKLQEHYQEEYRKFAE